MPSLKEHQEKRMQLAAQIQELAKRKDSWTAEDVNNWGNLNKQYDEHMAEMNAQMERERPARQSKSGLTKSNSAGIRFQSNGSRDTLHC